MCTVFVCVCVCVCVCVWSVSVSESESVCLCLCLCLCARVGNVACLFVFFNLECLFLSVAHVRVQALAVTRDIEGDSEHAY